MQPIIATVCNNMVITKMLIVREGAIFTILAPAKRRDVLEVWREKHAPAWQATDLRLSLSLTCDCHALATVTCDCPISVEWGGVGLGRAITFTGTSHGMVASTDFIRLATDVIFSSLLFTSLLFSRLYSFHLSILLTSYFLLSSLPYSLQIPAPFTSVLFSFPYSSLLLLCFPEGLLAHGDLTNDNHDDENEK